MLGFPMIVLLALFAAGEVGGTEGPFTDAKCLTCHERKTASLVADWRRGPHRGRPAAPPVMVPATTARYGRGRRKHVVPATTGRWVAAI
ncbi:MAG: hypothetical protein FD149_2709 [Rhodospirillaceae bacterium]|nr:MAG: hypothetical protein FD149_2709 [Rhodospirillaceae bacterium]